MHLVHVIDQLGLGGAERMAVDLANEAARRGHRVTVCNTRGVEILAREIAPAIEVVHLRRRARFDLAPVVRFVRQLRRSAADVLHVHMRSSMSLMLPFRALGVVPPVVFHDHYGSIERDTSVPRWFRIGHRAIDAYVGVSPALGAWARGAGMRADRVHVIENALDLSRLAAVTPLDLRAELKLPAGTRVALIVATVRPDKGIETALDALARLPSPRPVHLAVAGTLADPAYEAMLRARIAQHGLGDRVTFLGGRADVPALVAGADLAISASHTESGPLVLVEFARLGTPFVATRVGDIGRRLAAAGLPGFVESRDPTAMAAAIEQLLALAPAARAARVAAARAGLGEFDLAQVFPRWEAVYARARGLA